MLSMNPPPAQPKMNTELANFLAHARTATYASGKKAEIGEGKYYLIKKEELS
jgi:hypothetical protein